MNDTILIIDDKVKLCKILAQDFENVGYRCQYAVNSDDAIRIFSDQAIDVILLDLKLGAENGLDLLKRLLNARRAVPVIMVTGYATIENAVEAMKLGAFDYIQKPVNFTKLQKVVEHALTVSRLNPQNDDLEIGRIDSPLPIVTRNARMLAILQTLAKLAATDYPIFLCGESGTGKELFAEFIHARSPRKALTLYKLNCASLPASLMDNELFGHEKGAYTGANSAFAGIFERAHVSSLFLDEIGDMPLEIQAKILRTLQNHEIRRLGGKDVRNVDVRFIAATNKNITRFVEEGKFREDLFYRLNLAMIHIPPLRERTDDIPLLMQHFLIEFAKNHGQTAKTVNQQVMETLMKSHWQGNVRELKNVINYAAALANGATIEMHDLPPNLLKERETDAPENIRETLEKTLILDTLQQAKYNKKKAAELLHFSRRTLYNKLEKYGITD